MNYYGTGQKVRTHYGECRSVMLAEEMGGLIEQKRKVDVGVYSRFQTDRRCRSHPKQRGLEENELTQKKIKCGANQSGIKKSCISHDRIIIISYRGPVTKLR